MGPRWEAELGGEAQDQAGGHCLQRQLQRRLQRSQEAWAELQLCHSLGDLGKSTISWNCSFTH